MPFLVHDEPVTLDWVQCPCCLMRHQLVRQFRRLRHRCFLAVLLAGQVGLLAVALAVEVVGFPVESAAVRLLLVALVVVADLD